MTVSFLDCRNEVRAPRQPPADRRAWLAPEISPADWTVMRERYPEELARLYQPMDFDRQKEHAEGSPPQ